MSPSAGQIGSHEIRGLLSPGCPKLFESYTLMHVNTCAAVHVRKGHQD